MRLALNVLAVVAPDWLRKQVPATWFDRYGPRFAEYRLPPGRPERYVLAETIGADGLQLLQWIYTSPTPPWFQDMPAVEVLRQVWVQQFYIVEGALRWRQAQDLPPSLPRSMCCASRRGWPIAFCSASEWQRVETPITGEFASSI
jgi:transposase